MKLYSVRLALLGIAVPLFAQETLNIQPTDNREISFPAIERTSSPDEELPVPTDLVPEFSTNLLDWFYLSEMRAQLPELWLYFPDALFDLPEIEELAASVPIDVTPPEMAGTPYPKLFMRLAMDDSAAAGQKNTESGADDPVAQKGSAMKSADSTLDGNFENSLMEEEEQVDADGDRLPDEWEQTIIDFSGDPLLTIEDIDPEDDYDSDGFSNLQEYYFGSDPCDSNDEPVGRVAANHYHSMALTADGRVWSWGNNGNGQLGDGTTTARNAPVPPKPVPEMSGIVQIGAGQYCSFALDDEGSLWGWGYNGTGQISKDPKYNYPTPIKIHIPAPVASFACSDNHVLAVTNDGKIWAWGTNYYGELGQGHSNTISGIVEITRPAGMLSVKSLAAEGYSSYALDVSGKIWSWGLNTSGRLGDGSSINRHSPVAVDMSNGIPAVKAIAAGNGHALALGADGSVWSWGYNGYGDLGHGNTTSTNKPVQITSGLTVASALSTGAHHSMGLSPLGDVWGWGRNNRGQLGNNSTTTSTVPVQTSPVTDWAGILQTASGDEHNIALKSDGTVWSWGYNAYGQLGLGDTSQRNLPVRLANFKLTDDDTDADGLPDSWERFYFAGSLAQSGTDVAVTNGVSNAIAYAHRLNPNTPDNDNDGIRDTDEIVVSLDPLDWSDATGDLDGDRIPNLWEQEMGSDMTDPMSKPAVTSTVGTGQSIQTFINAVPGNSGNPTWAIIEVQPGIYEANINLPDNKRILLISSGSGGIPEIRGTSTSATISVYGESVVDGFRVTHAKNITGYGMYSYPYGGRGIARIVNCIIHGNKGNSGKGIYASTGRTMIANSSVFDNSAPSQANGLYAQGNAWVLLLNSIFWNPGGEAPEEIMAYGIIESRQTVVRDASISGVLVYDSLMNPRGFLTRNSPARGEGTLRAGVSRDIDGEDRGSLSDVGADQFVDSDDDGLPDKMESLGVVTPAADNDNDGLSNLVEYETLGSNLLVADTDGDGLNDGGELAAGSNPFDPDTDTDGMPDGWEVQHGLDPLDESDALADQDGDRIPNIWEYKRGTEPDNAGSRPSADWVVNPGLAGTANNVATIQQAINNSPTSASNPAHYSIIEVSYGIYPENVNISSGRKVTLLGELGYPATEIRSPSDNSYSLQINGEAFVDGFRISRTKDADDITYNGMSGVYVSVWEGTRQVSLSNLIVHGHRAGYGAGIYFTGGHLRLIHSTIYDNGSQYSGNAIYVSSSTATLDIQNCIVRSNGGLAPQVIHKDSSATVISSGSFLQGGEFGGSAADPLLTPYGWLKKGSPAINFCFASLVSRDINNELRVGSPDAGADEFLDSDDDGLPDWLEALGSTSPAADNDSDGLSNLFEYETTGSDPLQADIDGDGLNDGGEFAAGSNHFDADTDSDGMADGWEVQYGLDPIDKFDALEDFDGDRVPNLYEFANSTQPDQPSSFPTPHITVDPAVVTETTILKKTIQAAINEPLNANRHTVIRVKVGVYQESLTIQGNQILLLGDLGADLPVIAPSSYDAVSILEKSVAIDGFEIRNGSSTGTRRGLYVNAGLKTNQVRLSNCVITGFSAYSGSAVYLVQNQLTLVHCTILDNITISGSPLYVGSADFVLINSIVWNSGNPASQIFVSSSGSASVTTSLILGGEYGAISTAPLTDRYHGLMVGSPAIGAGTPLSVMPSLDCHGETRPSSFPDIGADQRIDLDSDTLPDWWEWKYFGNLSQTLTGDGDIPDPDRMTNHYEYLLDFDPSNPDTLGTGRGDLFDAVFTSIYDPWYPEEWKLDTDSDGLTDGQELYYATAASIADTNGDGIPDKVAIHSGISATSLDTDGDGILNTHEVLNGTNPILADSDGDGVLDDLDAFPLDSSRWDIPPAQSGDVTAPQILLITPENATPQ